MSGFVFVICRPLCVLTLSDLSIQDGLYVGSSVKERKAGSATVCLDVKGISWS